MADWDETRDFVTIGSGGGATMSALYLRSIGKDVLILEKTDMVGGSTAMSGGVLWIPNHPLQKAAGVPDSYEAGLAYMEATIGEVGPASSPARRHAFLTSGPKMVEFMISRGIKLLRAEGWSDYYDDRPGGCPRSRSLCGKIFDINELGAWTNLLRPSPVTRMPVYSSEGVKMAVAKKSLIGVLTVMKIGLRMTLAKLRNQQLRAAGMALQGRMLQAVLRDGAEIRLNAPVSDLIEEKGRVVGVLTEKDGKPWRIKARDGVLINAGGFSHNEEMRKKYQPQPSTTAWTNSNPGDTGEMINIAKAYGAATDLMDATIWVAGTLPPGAARPRFANMNLAKPHLIMVDKKGQRFVNECVSYMELGQSMYAHGAVPAYMVFDHQHRSDYNWDMTPPGVTPEAWISSGYMKRADTLEELAAMTGIDPAGLKATVERYNGFCKDGKDLDFHRGEREYDKFWADFTQKPNPTMGTIAKAPFYAVETVPSDVGTFGGIMCDEHARVLREDGSTIPGLYAAGNCTASVMGRCYPGAGASIAAAFVFGYRAAQHATGTLPND